MKGDCQLRFGAYIKERLFFIVINLVTFLLFAAIMGIAKFSLTITLWIFIIWFAPLCIYILYEYFKVKRYYSDVESVLDGLDQKFLISEVIKEPNFLEGKILHEVLREANKSMNENVKKYRLDSEEYKEYIETWVHEIKTPIASAKLVIENHNDEVTRKIDAELDKVDGFIEQVLYYSRSKDVSKDYVVKKVPLKPIVMKVAKSNARDFINKRISLSLGYLDEEVFTDEKWLGFIINQIIQNAIKYSKPEGAKIEINSEKQKEFIRLTIKDNGVGISKRDIDRVFEKGFTGDNGRIFGKSTGIGLYLCKKLCIKLNLGLDIRSTVGEGTELEIRIPLGGTTNI